MMPLFKRYVFPYANSNMYITTENLSALVIDPNISEEALKYLISENVCNVTVLLTHEHYDHTSGLTWLMSHFSGKVICHEETAKSLREGKNNRPVIIASNRMDKLSGSEIKTLVHSLPQGYRYDPDITFTDIYSFDWQGHSIKMVPCPGHSRGSCCIELDGSVMATGDSLILRTPVITRLPGGSMELYQNITRPYLNGISDEMLILPGHGESFHMKESRYGS